MSSRHTVMRSPLPPNLDTKEAWHQFTTAAPMSPPPRVTPAELAALNPRDARIYNHNRGLWHAHYNLMLTRQVRIVQEQIGTILDANQHPIGRARTSILVEAPSGRGKTSLIDDLLKKRDREIRSLKSDRTDTGDDRHPILRVSIVGGKITFLGFMERVAKFYAVPDRGRPSQTRLFDRCLTHIVDCETEVVYIDEVQNLPWSVRTRDTTREFLRALSNQARVTVIYAGVDVSDSGFWGGDDSQQRRRTVNSLTLEPYTIFDDAGNREWVAILKRLEERLLLTSHTPGMFEKLGDYLWSRTEGNLKSLDTLYLAAAATAIRTGVEAITESILESVHSDHAAHPGRLDRRIETSNRRRHAAQKEKKRTPAANN